MSRSTFVPYVGGRRSPNTVAGSGGAGAPNPRDIEWASEDGTASALSSTLAQDSEAGTATGDPAATLTQPSEGGTASVFDATAAPEYAAEDGTVSLAQFSINDIRGMPDSWVDEDAPTSNHGTDVELEIRPPAGLDGERRAILWFDFTGASGLTIDAVVLDVVVSAGLLTALDCLCELRRVATEPVTEAGATWNNHESNQGTLVASVSVTLNRALGSDTPEQIRWDADDLEPGESYDNIFGSWLYLKIVPDPGIGQVSPTPIKSGENATTADQPLLSLEAST